MTQPARNVGADLLGSYDSGSVEAALRGSPWRFRFRYGHLRSRAVPPEEREQKSALRDYERIADLLTRIPPDVLVNAGSREEAEREWLQRTHGITPERVEAAYRARREELEGRVHPPAPAMTVTAGASMPASVVAAGAQPTAGLTAADRRGALLNVVRARAAGHDPDRLWPGWRERLR